ncbi:hypothetical protein P153DRAFT_389560 [Dothidotthia symphoricarpi CBS 119687]|uniref:Uncharacterized protein n=1 Tax=Dothidotthia symphoricarpi CBS 119687 TaxID=1392245 RepID=A0A6A6A067_9PLEO|nr:uncharacterized protein P153DRAFT_389560 [Dothidotthia symphoricarpi CBS 119687]KAF2125402.1 hypothetical protein P153DRAFT_389560 [Dothidotthia symphoricarpi CBS 119687]
MRMTIPQTRAVPPSRDLVDFSCRVAFQKSARWGWCKNGLRRGLSGEAPATAHLSVWESFKSLQAPGPSMHTAEIAWIAPIASRRHDHLACVASQITAGRASVDAVAGAMATDPAPSTSIITFMAAPAAALSPPSPPPHNPYFYPTAPPSVHSLSLCPTTTPIF